MKKIMKFAVSLLMAIIVLIPVNAKAVFKVTVDLGEGTYVNGEHMAVIEVEEGKMVGDAIDFNEFIHNINDIPGYILVGFAVDDETEISFNGEDLSILKPRKDMTIKGVYAKSYDITFDYNGRTYYGETSVTETVIPGNKNYFGTPKNDEWEDAFAGWSTEKSGEPEFTTEDLEKYAFTKDMTFYATYKPAVTVTLDGNGGVFSSMDGEVPTLTIKAPRKYKFSSFGDTPHKNGAYFIGWSLEKDGKV